jgi:gliding motility-associated-like protein
VSNIFGGNDTVICAGTSANLSATGADNYSWQPASFLSCTNCSNPVSSSRNDISYYVKGSNTFGCEKTDTIFITVKQPFRLTGLKVADSVCAGKSIQLNIEGAENYLWLPADGLNNNTIKNPVADPITSTTYKVIGYDSSNCFKDSTSIFIKVNTVPIVNAGADIIINSGRTVILTPQFSNDVTSWLWQPATGLSCSNCPNPVASPAGSTSYTIQVTNSSGCSSTDEISIRVNCNKNSVFIPTAFSPNGDEVNDIFYPLNVPGSGSINISSLMIYNRYGQIVFQKNHFNSNDKTKGWDGKYNGRECPAGSYIYTISFICGNRQVVSFGGNFLLVR